MTSVALHLLERRVSRRDRRTRWTAGATLPFVVLAILFWAMGVLAYWVLAPYEVLRDFDQGPRRVMEKVVTQGGSVRMVSSACKQMGVPGVINRAFVDGAIYHTPTVVSTLSDCRDGMERAVVIPVPHSLPPGPYHLDVTLSYRVNPLRTKVYRYVTEEFEVVAPSARR
jgi:hypothetical protein